MRNVRNVSVVAGSVLMLSLVALVLFGPTEGARPEKSKAPRAATASAVLPKKVLTPAQTVVAPAATVKPAAVTAAPPAAVTVAPPRAGILEAKVDPKEVARVREGLRNPDPKVRLASVRAARDLKCRDLEADVALILEKERFVPVRRVAAQVLALGDTTGHTKQLRDLKQDPDVIVQLNASFGLARGGDELEQGLLLAFCEASREAPQLLPLVARALEDPSLKSPAVIARFQMVADDPNQDQATRDKARDVLRAKRG